ncbi:MAG: hypothetical protein BWX78_01138 [Firmicutes bacterium ADurb.Bin099]|nr:MAG: hypothetical protein BWX78_01138 [Firmicutes bacterium ADurb.Bin099]
MRADKKTIKGKNDNLSGKLDSFLVKTDYANSGGSFTRDEMNER